MYQRKDTAMIMQKSPSKEGVECDYEKEWREQNDI